MENPLKSATAKAFANDRLFENEPNGDLSVEKIAISLDLNYRLGGGWVVDFLKRMAKEGGVTFTVDKHNAPLGVSARTIHLEGRRSRIERMINLFNTQAKKRGVQELNLPS